MFQSKLFTKTSKNAPKDEISISSQYLLRAGFIDKLMAGVYTYLPLGFLVLKKIENIIRQEMNDLGAQEILMPSLTPKNIWEQTGRWETFTDLYKFKDQSEKEFALAATHEEVITPLMKQFINSYKDLPMAAFQIQNKFRNELRAKGGLLRGREFLMKDLYAFHKDESEMDEYYLKATEAYKKILKLCGLEKDTFLTYASGGTFSKYSHEFQTVSEAGEDLIYLCEKCKVAINKEIINEQINCPVCGENNFQEKKSIEVANIFKLKDKYSKAFNLEYKDEKGGNQIILMSCYGIGLSRLLATIIEINNDQDGMIWPKTVTPFQIHLLDLNNRENSEVYYHKLAKAGFEVLYDDREAGAGEKLKDADLIGISVRLVSSAKTGDKLEIKYRDQKESKILDYDAILFELKNYYKNV